MLDATMSLLPWLGLAALIWYMAACVAADKKPKAAPTPETTHTRLLYVIRKSICGLSLGGLYMDDERKED